MFQRLSLLLGALTLSCATHPVPCRTATSCDSGHECLANRCVPVGSEPVTPATRRLVLNPSQTAVSNVSAGALPPAAYLGGPSAQRQELYLGFDLTGAAGATLDTAFLLLRPSPGSAPLSEDIEVTVERLASPWSPRDVAAGFLPRVTNGSGRGLAHASSVVRVDVTQLLQQQLAAPDRFWGLVVHSTQDSQRSFAASTGISGDAPRLELYLTTASSQVKANPSKNNKK